MARVMYGIWSDYEGYERQLEAVAETEEEAYEMLRAEYEADEGFTEDFERFMYVNDLSVHEIQIGAWINEIF